MKHQAKILLLCFSLFSVCTFAQEQVESRLVLKNAELTKNLGTVKNAFRLVGKVVFQQDNVTIYCDSADFYKDRNYLEVVSNVRIIQPDTFAITGDKLIYEGDFRTAQMFGDVIYKDDSITGYYNQMDYNLNDQVGHYYGGGKTVDSQNTLISKEGIYHKPSGNLTFKDSVIVYSPEQTIYTDTLKYNTYTKISEVFTDSRIISKNGNEIITDNGLFNTETKESTLSNGFVQTEEFLIKGQTLKLNDVTQEYEAVGKVKLTSLEDQTVIESGRALGSRLTGESLITDNPVMKMLVEGDTLYIKADTLFSYKDSLDRQFMLAYPNVQIFKTDLQGIADSLSFLRSDSVIQLFQDPVLWANDSQLSGDSISIFIANETIDRMELHEDGFMVFNDSLENYNQVKGRDIYIYFKENRLDRSEVIGNAESLYFDVDEESSLLRGANKTVSTNIQLLFKEGDIKNIIWYGAPTDGKYVPPHELDGEKKALDGFKWRVDEKPVLSTFQRKIIRN